MNKALHTCWNTVIGSKAVVWNIGYVARRPVDAAASLSRLNDTKHLIRGDNNAIATGEALGWAGPASAAMPN